MIQLTPSAAKAIQRFIKAAENPGGRTAHPISGGGCSGFQYGMSLETDRGEDDTSSNTAASRCWSIR